MVPREEGSTVSVDGVTLGWDAVGSGPLVLLLHGFPETRSSWGFVQRRLAAAGFRAVAPDVRGVGTSDAPTSIQAYRAEALAADVAALIANLGEGSPAAVVGHDWGGLQAWWAAMLHPELVDRLVVLNAAHPLAYSTEPRRKLYRLLTLAFEASAVLDAVSRATRFTATKFVLRHDPARPVPDDLVAEYVRAWRIPGATVAMLAKDRAERRDRDRVRTAVRPISCPVMTIWGDRDSYWPAHGAEPYGMVHDLRVEHVADATHWVAHDEPERVTELLLDFLGQARDVQEPLAH